LLTWANLVKFYKHIIHHLKHFVYHLWLPKVDFLLHYLIEMNFVVIISINAICMQFCSTRMVC